MREMVRLTKPMFGLEAGTLCEFGGQYRDDLTGEPRFHVQYPNHQDQKLSIRELLATDFVRVEVLDATLIRLNHLLAFIENGRPSTYAPWRDCDKDTMVKILLGIENVLL